MIWTYYWQFFKKMVVIFPNCGGGVTHSKEMLNSYSMTWKILYIYWNDQAIKKHEGWWHRNNITTADLLRRLIREWDGMKGQCSLFVGATYCHLSFVYLYSHSWMHNVSFKGKNQSWQEFMSVKEQKKMTLPVHQGQGWWHGGSVNLFRRGWGQSPTKGSEDRMHIDNGPMPFRQCVSQGLLSGG